LQGGRKRGIYGSLDAIDYEWIAGVHGLRQAIALRHTEEMSDQLKQGETLCVD
jgi:hypothetical protein